MRVLSVGSLPLGFRFHPTDVELINHYLKGKINRREEGVQVIREIDVCGLEPWDLPKKSLIRSEDPEWFFFCPRNRKYPNGQRTNRATEAGYWKATGKDRKIRTRKPESRLIGSKRTLVFYRGRAPAGERTNWVMHEYRVEKCEELKGSQDSFVLCRLFRKAEVNGVGSVCDLVDPNELSPAPMDSTIDDDIYENSLDSQADEKSELENQKVCQIEIVTKKLDKLAQSDVLQSRGHILETSNSRLTNEASDNVCMDDEGLVAFSSVDLPTCVCDDGIDVSSLFYEPVFESLDDLCLKKLAACRSFDIGSSFDVSYAANLDHVFLNPDDPSQHLEPSVEAVDESFDDRGIHFGKPPLEIFAADVKTENDTGIQIRSREIMNNNFQTLSFQGTAPRRICLQTGIKNRVCGTDNEQEESTVNCICNKDKTDQLRSSAMQIKPNHPHPPKRSSSNSKIPFLPPVKAEIPLNDVLEMRDGAVGANAFADGLAFGTVFDNQENSPILPLKKLEDVVLFTRDFPEEPSISISYGKTSAKVEGRNSDFVCYTTTIMDLGSVSIRGNNVYKKQMIQRVAKKSPLVTFRIAIISILFISYSSSVTILRDDDIVLAVARMQGPFYLG